MQKENNIQKPYIGPQRHQVIAVIIVSAVLILAGLIVYIAKACRVTEVSVTGNQHYTVDQIEEMVMEGPLGHNSLYLYFKYRNRNMDNVPFVETMEVNVISPSSISITVYEKSIAGCVGYLDRFMYFDKDGTVVEASPLRQMDIPYVTGLTFDHVIMYEKLPIENEEVFKNILGITQLLSKYKIIANQIYFDSDNNVTLYFDKARVKLGSFENIDEKMIKLQGIIPKLDGLEGVLYMEDYTEDAKEDYITFQRDDVERHVEVTEESTEENIEEEQDILDVPEQ